MRGQYCNLFTMSNNAVYRLNSTNEYLISAISEQHYRIQSTYRLQITGGAGRDRTDDLLLAKQALSQLSYSPRPESLVGLGRLELPTSRLSSARSNQLSYRPENRVFLLVDRMAEGMRRRRNVRVVLGKSRMSTHS